MIRLARFGAKKVPFYRIVVTEKSSARDSGYIEDLGYFDQLGRNKDRYLHIDLDRLEQRTSQGAQMSRRVAYLIKRYKLDQAKAKAEEAERIKREQELAAKAARKEQEEKEAAAKKGEAESKPASASKKQSGAVKKTATTKKAAPAKKASTTKSRSASAQSTSEKKSQGSSVDASKEKAKNKKSS